MVFVHASPEHFTVPWLRSVELARELSRSLGIFHCVGSVCRIALFNNHNKLMFTRVLRDCLLTLGAMACEGPDREQRELQMQHRPAPYCGSLPGPQPFDFPINLVYVTN
jgi:hypothetical protein